MKTLAVRNFISIISIFFFVLCQSISLVITPGDVCCNIRNVKFIKVVQFKQMFVTTVCVLFLMINYLHKFISNLSEKTAPLRQLLRNDIYTGLGRNLSNKLL